MNLGSGNQLQEQSNVDLDVNDTVVEIDAAESTFAGEMKKPHSWGEKFCIEGKFRVHDAESIC